MKTNTRRFVLKMVAEIAEECAKFSWLTFKKNIHAREEVVEQIIKGCSGFATVTVTRPLQVPLAAVLEIRSTL